MYARSEYECKSASRSTERDALLQDWLLSNSFTLISMARAKMKLRSLQGFSQGFLQPFADCKLKLLDFDTVVHLSYRVFSYKLRLQQQPCSLRHVMWSCSLLLCQHFNVRKLSFQASRLWCEKHFLVCKLLPPHASRRQHAEAIELSCKACKAETAGGHFSWHSLSSHIAKPLITTDLCICVCVPSFRFGLIDGH